MGFVALGALWAALQPVAAAGILPAGFHASAHPGANGVVGISIPARSGLAVTIFINNIVVSLEVLAGGFTLGLLSAYVLATNGAMLGVLGMLELKAGGFAQFVRLIVPHGLLELSCIAVSGSAGFLIARALIDPGRRTRGEALTQLVPLIGDTVLGVAGCLVIAGLTEGIVTTWDLPLALALGHRARPQRRVLDTGGVARASPRRRRWAGWAERGDGGRGRGARGRGDSRDRDYSRARCFNLK